MLKNKYNNNKGNKENFRLLQQIFVCTYMSNIVHDHLIIKFNKIVYAYIMFPYGFFLKCMFYRTEFMLSILSLKDF